ncbi:MAG: SAM-dependent methyltransferase [Sediminibacterium sp.]|nr:SAM-dependent methyltransferase [Sediminibacterium sp.]
MKNSQSLYLFPSSIFDSEQNDWLYPSYLTQLKNCDFIFCETAKVTRRFLKSIKSGFNLDQVIELKNNLTNWEIEFVEKIKKGQSLGLMSDCGCPGIADPGQNLVQLAHQHHVKVVPLIGPSSIFLTLMASGLNGQQFQFYGYLPKEDISLKKNLLTMGNDRTHIFIETPYRNQKLLAIILQTLSNQRWLCLGIDVGSAQEQIITKQVSQWKQNIPLINKKQVVFLIQ